MTNDEKMLIQFMRDGSDKDFGLLVRHYGPTLMTFVGHIVVQQEDAEDVVQNTFVAAYEHRKGFDPQRASLTTWLQRIAYHEALHHLRRRKRLAVLPLDVGDDFPDELPTDTTAEQLDEAILRLTPEEQMLLQFYYFDQRHVNGTSILGIRNEFEHLLEHSFWGRLAVDDGDMLLLYIDDTNDRAYVMGGKYARFNNELLDHAEAVVSSFCPSPLISVKSAGRYFDCLPRLLDMP